MGILDKHLPPQRPNDEGASSTADATGDPLRHGSLIQSIGGTSLMLDLRFRDGKRVAMPYGYLSQAELEPAQRLVLRFASATVTISGRNLDQIYIAVLSHTAIAIVQAEATFDAGGDGPYVEGISIEPC